MKTIISFIIILVLLTGCSFKNEKTFDLDNSTWKFCDDKSTGRLYDVLIFNENYLFLKSDTVFIKGKDSAIGLVDRVDYEYVDRKTFFKRF